MNRFLSLSIRNRMIVLIVVMTMVSLGIIIYSAIIQRQNDLEDAEQVVARLVNEVSNDQIALVDNTKQLFNVLSRVPAVQIRDRKAVNRLLADLVNSNPQYANLIIADRSGLLWASAVPVQEAISYADRKYFRAAVSSGSFSSGEYGISRTLHKPVMSYAAPFRDTSGNITDVAIVSFTLDKYKNLFKTSRLPENTSIVISDHKGTILFAPMTPQLVGQQDSRQILDHMSQGKDQGIFEANGNVGIRRIFAFRNLYLEGESSPHLHVRAGIPVKIVNAKALRAAALNIGIMSAILLLATAFVVYFSKRWIIDKITLLRDTSRKLAAGDLSVRIGGRLSGGELGELGQAFDEMADKLAGDILKLKQADDTISEREGRLGAILDVSQAAIFMLDSRGRIIFANRFMEKMFGLSGNELLESPYEQLVHPDEAEANTAQLNRLISGELEHCYAERHYLRRDDSDFWGYLSCRRYEDSSGQLKALVAVIADITTRKQAELLLQESETRFRSVVDSSPAAMHFYRLEQDGSLILTGANPAAGRILGISHEALLHKTVEEAFPQLRSTSVPDMYRRIASGMLVPQSFELPYMDERFSGFYEVTAFRIGEKSIAVSFIDISDRKRVEQELLEKEEHYRALVEQSAAWIWETDHNMRNIYSNRNVEVILGYSVDEFLRLDAFSLLHPDDIATANELVETARTSCKGWKGVVLRLKHKDDTWRSIQTTGYPKHDNEGNFLGLRSIDLDITDRVRLQEERDRAQRLESVGILAGGIAHDFNNLLTGIMGNIFYSKNCIGKNHDAYKPLDNADQACQRAAGLARKLLIFARGGQPVKKVFSLKHILEETVLHALKETNVRGVVEIPDSLHDLEADEGQIVQSLHNIVTNAVQAMPDGGSLIVRGENVFLEKENRFGLAKGDYIVVTFTDQGCGISEADQERIFDPYFTTRENGNGLGLASAYAVVRKHGGQISATSSPGNGATFTVYLPALPAEHPQQAVATEEAAPVADATETILVMDDEEMIRELAVLTLGKMGYRVETCRDGNEAIDLYQAARNTGNPFSVVIMDLTIPGSMGGLEAAKRILACDPEAALVVSSGYSDDPVMANYRDYGFCAAIEKPYRCEDVARVISIQKKTGKPAAGTL